MSRQRVRDCSLDSADSSDSETDEKPTQEERLQAISQEFNIMAFLHQEFEEEHQGVRQVQKLLHTHTGENTTYTRAHTQKTVRR